ncbi:MAG: hypothetical protein U1F87_11800 [Kiritimatiellia bacterium]
MTALLAVCGLTAAAQQVELRGDLVTIRANRNSLRDVLAQFGRYDVAVRMDPAVNATVDGDLVDQPVDEALSSLLRNFGYTTRWRTLEGPGGPVERLVEVAVFRQGGATGLVVVDPPPAALRRILKSADGTEYVAEEVLIGLREGTTPDQFKALLAGIGGSVIDVTKGVGVYRVKLPAGAGVPTCWPRCAATPPSPPPSPTACSASILRWSSPGPPTPRSPACARPRTSPPGPRRRAAPSSPCSTPASPATSPSAPCCAAASTPSAPTPP